MRAILTLAMAMAVGPALAQTSVPQDAAAPAAVTAPSADPGLEPTLSITAHVEAKSIRIEQRGRTQVSIWSEPGGKGEWKFDRHGVPNPIPLGKTFNNVVFDLDAHATIDDRGVTVGGSAGPGEMSPAPADVPTPAPR